VDLFKPFGQDYHPFFLAIAFAFGGVGLGTAFYGGTLLQKKWKDSIIIVTGVIIVAYLGLSYVIFDIPGIGKAFEILARIGLTVLLCMVTATGTYGILKQQQNIVFATGFGVVFFFFFTRLIFRNEVFIEQQLEILLLFFVVLMVYLEIGSKSMFYWQALKKMTASQAPTTLLLQRFNSVLNWYVLIIPILYLSVYGASYAIVQFGADLFGFTGEELMSINLTTFAGMLLLVVIIIACAFMLWSIIPREKNRPLPPMPTQRQQTQTSDDQSFLM